MDPDFHLKLASIHSGTNADSGDGDGGANDDGLSFQ